MLSIVWKFFLSNTYLYFPVICFSFIFLYLLFKKKYSEMAFIFIFNFWLCLFLFYFKDFSLFYILINFSYSLILFISLFYFLNFFSEILNFSADSEFISSLILFLTLSFFSYFKILFEFDLVSSLFGFVLFFIFRIIYFWFKNIVDEYVSKFNLSSFLNQWTYFWLFSFINSVLFFVLICFWNFDYFLLVKYIHFDFFSILCFFLGIISVPYFLFLCDYLVDYLFSRLFSVASGYSYRAQTLKVSIKWVFKFLFAIIFLIFWLSVLSVDISTFSWNLSLIVALAGVGFKGIIDDFMNGICVLIEDSINIGEFIHIEGISGRVEDVTLRVIKLRNFDGSLFIIPFRKVDVIRNRSKEFVYIVFDIVVDPKVSCFSVFSWLDDAYSDFKNSKEAIHYLRNILEDLEMIGIKSVTASGVFYEARLKILPSNTRFIKGIFLQSLKNLADQRGIPFGFEYSVLSKIQGKQFQS